MRERERERERERDHFFNFSYIVTSINKCNLQTHILAASLTIISNTSGAKQTCLQDVRANNICRCLQLAAIFLSALQQICTSIAESSKCLCLYAISLQKCFGIICCSLAVRADVLARNQMFTASRNRILTLKQIGRNNKMSAGTSYFNIEANWKKQQND